MFLAVLKRIQHNLCIIYDKNLQLESSYEDSTNKPKLNILQNSELVPLKNINIIKTRKAEEVIQIKGD